MKNVKKIKKTLNRFHCNLLLALSLLLASAANLMAQQAINGTVTDAGTGNTLPGVNIKVKGTTAGTSTNAQGHYELRVESLQDTLVFSFIGYATKEVSINGRTEIDISMKSQTISGQEMVVVGYGKQKRTDLTGAVSSVPSSRLGNANISTPDQALQGQIAGVDVHTNTHAPGGSNSVNIRGTASLNAGGTPLYVIDGMPINNSFSTTSAGGVNGTGAASNPLNSVDPSNIQSIQVLKDASATAIYGSRGANGVILITTKKGVSGQQNIDFKSELGFSQISKKLDFINAQQYAQQANDIDDIVGRPHTYSSQEISNFGEGTNWQDEITQRGVQQKYQLTFSGGSENIRYLVSGNIKDNEGILRNSNFKRYGARVNVDGDVNDRFTIGTNLSYTVSDNHKLYVSSKGYGSNPGLITALVVAPPTIPARDSNGNIVNFSGYKGGTGNENPLVMTDKYKMFGNTNRLIGNIYGNYDVLNNLSLRVSFGADIRNFRMHKYFPIGSQAAGGSNGRASQMSELNTNIVNNNTLTYQTKINDIHSIKVLAGFAFQEERTENLSAASYGFPSDFYKYNNLGIGNNPQSPGTGVSKWKLLSYLGRLNYSFNDKYLLTASFRIDGSSKFGPNNKYGKFPSAALAWQMGKEQFIKNLNLFSHLKIRFGYGKTGNDNIGTYRSQSLISTAFNPGSAYLYNDILQPIAYPNGVANPDLGWEKTQEWNYGLDMGFVNDRISISANYYYKKTTDLILNQPLPHQTGYGGVLSNIGSMKNRGVEIELNSQNVMTSTLNWNTNFNISANRNEILSLASADYIYTGWAGGKNVQPHGRQVARLEEGHSVSSFYGSVYEGVWNSQGEIDEAGTMPSANPGEIRWRDVNGDGTYNVDGDDKFLGNANPDFSFGMTNDFTFKQWNLHVFLYGKYGNDVLNLTAERFEYSDFGTSTTRLKRWTLENPDNNVPTTPGCCEQQMQRVNSKIVEDGTFLRIQNVTLTYNLPIAKWSFGRTLRNASIGIAVDNLAVLTKYSGYDPEVNSFGDSNTVNGVDRYAYPASRTFRFNLKFGL